MDKNILAFMLYDKNGSILVNIIVGICVLYTFGDIIYWGYYYTAKHFKQKNDDYRSNNTNTSTNADSNSSFNTLTPEMFKSTFNRIFQKAKEIRGNDNFSSGRRAAYFEVFNIMKKDFIAYDVEFKRWNPNMPSHTISCIIKEAELAINESKKCENNNGVYFFKGREAAYLEIIDIILGDFTRYGVNLKEFGLENLL